MKKVFYITIIFSLVFGTKHLQAQNLILNDGFEVGGDSCANVDTIFYHFPMQYTSWFIPNSSTPDIHCTCCNLVPGLDTAWGVPNNDHGFQYPHQGKCYAGIGCYGINIQDPTLYDNREYLSTPFLHLLEIGKKYKATCFINLANNYRFNSEASNKFGFLFSTYILNETSTTTGGYPRIKKKPQYENDSIIADTLNWVKINYSFIADSAYQYLTIGNFEPDTALSFKHISTTVIFPSVYGSYYYIDDVSLVEDTSSGVGDGVREVESRKSRTFGIVYPNPASQSIVISHQYPKLNWEVNTIEVTNLLGQQQNVIVEKLTTENCQLNTANLPSGIYFIKATDVNGNVMNGKFVKE
ncbi:MAG: hypothetical protein RJA07_2007 [Bacteroidota bacterium]|jgi:hypothetical protein